MRRASGRCKPIWRPLSGALRRNLVAPQRKDGRRAARRRALAAAGGACAAPARRGERSGTQARRGPRATGAAARRGAPCRARHYRAQRSALPRAAEQRRPRRVWRGAARNGRWRTGRGHGSTRGARARTHRTHTAAAAAAIAAASSRGARRRRARPRRPAAAQRSVRAGPQVAAEDSRGDARPDLASAAAARAARGGLCGAPRKLLALAAAARGPRGPARRRCTSTHRAEQ